MALDTYANLQTAITAWAGGRGDLSTSMADFIALAEAKMNRYLRTKDMVTKNATFSITGEYVAVPTSFGGAKVFYLNTGPAKSLTYMSDEQLTDTYGGLSGTPEAFTVQGSNFRFAPVPGSATSATLVYWLKVPALSVSNTTNWVLTANPDAYMYGAMGEICAYLKDFTAAQGWETMMYRVMDEIQAISAKDKSGGTSLAARPA